MTDLTIINFLNEIFSISVKTNPSNALRYECNEDDFLNILYKYKYNVLPKEQIEYFMMSIDGCVSNENFDNEKLNQIEYLIEYLNEKGEIITNFIRQRMTFEKINSFSESNILFEKELFVSGYLKNNIGININQETDFILHMNDITYLLLYIDAGNERIMKYFNWFRKL